MTVTSGGSVRAEFALSCAARPGAVEIVTATTGIVPDPDGYSVSLDDGTATAMAINATLSVPDLPAGPHRVTLAGVADNCLVQGATSRPVSVEFGATTKVGFAVICLTPEEGVLAVTTLTTDANPDPDGYTLSIDDVPVGSIAINLTRSFPVLAGPHRVLLGGLAPNCAVQGDNPQQVNVGPRATTTVTFAVVCPRPAGSAWRSVRSGTTKSLQFISGTHAKNVFVAGAGAVCDGPSCGEMAILHYGGGDWETQYTHPGGVLGLWAAPTGEAFALAEGPFPAQLLYYDGHQWDLMPVQPESQPNSQATLYALWGSSATDVFAVGYRFGFDDGVARGYVTRYDGSRWSSTALSGVDDITLSDIWGSSATDVYAVGNSASFDAGDIRSIILHYDGRVWTESQRLPGVLLSYLWGTSASDLYATGTSGGFAAIYHFDGRRWSPMPAPATPELSAVWASSPGDVYALGQGGSIWHWNGTVWQEIQTNTTTLRDIWGSSAANIAAVGDLGTILHGP